MTMNSAVIREAVEALNRALAEDPKAVRQLFAYRVPCNQALADDPTVQVRTEESGASVGVLGIINGILGTEPGTTTGYIGTEHDVICPAHGRIDEKPLPEFICPVPACGQKLQTGPLLFFSSRMLPIGPTGEFPMGQLNPEDEGELGIAFEVKRDSVMIHFGTPVAWIGMKPSDARQFAVFLMDRANVADEADPIIRVSGEVECSVCGDLYRNHPHDMKQLDHEGHPFLRVRCDGRRLKL
jgi:hypothetical protein